MDYRGRIVRAQEAIRAQGLDWLLGQQYRDVHPYTNADPGGWAWTDLSGGVPDADDTPGAVLAFARGAGAGQSGSHSKKPAPTHVGRALSWRAVA